MHWIDDLKEKLKKVKKYAPFFDWPDKQIKERGILQSFIESRELAGQSVWKNIRNSEIDPPDCVAEDDQGNLIAVEITELVDQKARQLNEKGKERSPQKLYRLWEDEEIIQKLEGILKQKDGKCEKIKKRTEIFRKTVLLIHTDEDEITGQRIVAILEKKCFEALNNIDDAYLMLSYDPSIKHYPIFTLALEKSK